MLQKQVNALVVFHHATFVMAVVFLVLVVPATAAEKTDYTKLPGYVDFGAMEIFGDVEATVEVFLKGSLLVLAREAVADDTIWVHNPDYVAIIIVAAAAEGRDVVRG